MAHDKIVAIVRLTLEAFSHNTRAVVLREAIKPVLLRRTKLRPVGSRGEQAVAQPSENGRGSSSVVGI